MSAKSHPHDSRSGFTLTEIALTLGIIAFALVAIIGMIPVALQSDREAADDTALAAAANHVSSDLYSRGFAQLTGAASKPWPYFFDTEGVPTAVQNDALYRCDVLQNGVVLPASTALTPGTGQTSSHLLELEIQFTWPVGAPVVQTRKVSVTIANYE